MSFQISLFFLDIGDNPPRITRGCASRIGTEFFSLPHQENSGDSRAIGIQGCLDTMEGVNKKINCHLQEYFVRKRHLNNSRRNEINGKIKKFETEMKLVGSLETLIRVIYCNGIELLAITASKFPSSGWPGKPR